MNATCSINVKEFLSVVEPGLARGDATGLSEAVLARWLPTQLCDLLYHDNADVRRTVALTLGLIGGQAFVGCLARALHDPDHQVNQMAEHGLWSIWNRCGLPQSAELFTAAMALMDSEQYKQAVAILDAVIAVDPNFAEAYHQRALARFLLGRYSEAIEDYRRAIRLMPVHFAAVAGMGHCYVQLGQFDRALGCYRRTLTINPHQPELEEAVAQLQAIDTTNLLNQRCSLPESDRITRVA